LEPSALRESDQFTAQPGLGADGSHLAATLYYLARSRQHTNHALGQEATTWVYDQVAARLSELIDDVYAIGLDQDERRALLTLEVTDRNGTVHPARALSDGTLRFLALAVLELDPQASGLVCLEEPENGIHPARIPAMLQLLQDIATDVDEPVGPDNPFRQVIVNTHSPVVVRQVPDDSLLIAESKEIVQHGQRFAGVRFSWLPGTWRQIAYPDIHTVAKGNLLSYLNTGTMEQLSKSQPGKSNEVRVVDRPDVQALLPLFSEAL
jgi:predicted ATPase